MIRKELKIRKGPAKTLTSVVNCETTNPEIGRQKSMASIDEIILQYIYIHDNSYTDGRW